MSYITQGMLYRKQQILRGTKLSQFTGFQQNVGKTVVVLLNYNTYSNKPLKLVEKTFVFCRKSAKTVKVLYHEDLLFTVICCIGLQLVTTGNHHCEYHRVQQSNTYRRILSLVVLILKGHQLLVFIQRKSASLPTFVWLVLDWNKGHQS